MENRVGDVKINGAYYRTIVQTNRERDIVDFAPRAATPGGSIVHSQLGLYQPLLQTDWRHGIGFPWYSDSQGYMDTEGDIDTRHDGIVMRHTKSTSSATDPDDIAGFTVFNGRVFAWGDGGLSMWDGSAWTQPYTTAKVNFALATGTYLFYCPDGVRIRKVDTSWVHSDAGNGANSTDYSFLMVHGGKMYAVKDGTNRVHYGTEPDLSDLEGAAADDDAEIYIGPSGDFNVLGGISLFGKAYFFKEDGPWHLGEDLIARRAIDFRSEASSSNFRSWAVHNNYLIFPIRDDLYQWNGVRQVSVKPGRLNDQFPYKEYGRFTGLTTVGTFLYYIGRTNQTTYEEHLLCFDGVGTHKLAELVTNGTDEITAMGYDSVNNRVWYAYKDVSQTTIKYIPLQDQSDLPEADFATSGTHSIISSRLDMGFRWVDKSSPRFWIEGSGLSANVKLTLYYSIDGGAWVSLGDITSDGITEKTFSGSPPTVEYKYLQYKIEFSTNSITASPILEGVTISFLMRPEDGYGESVPVIISYETETDGYTDARSPSQLRAALKAARNSKAPIEYIDIHGDTHWAYISALEFASVEEHEELAIGKGNIEQVAYVNIVKVRV